GVESGTFPFIVGLVIVAGSLFNLVQGWLQARAIILGPAELGRLGMLFVPAAVFVGIIPLIGIYPAAAFYVFGALAWHRRGSLLIPLTFGMQPVSAIILLSSMYWGALFGGSVTSILFNIPGEPSSVATTFDGYPMARDGRPTTALATAFGSAAFGALAGVVLITLLGSWVAKVALAFGPPAYFAVYF